CEGTAAPESFRAGESIDSGAVRPEENEISGRPEPSNDPGQPRAVIFPRRTGAKQPVCPVVLSPPFKRPITSSSLESLEGRECLLNAHNEHALKKELVGTDYLHNSLFRWKSSSMASNSETRNTYITVYMLTVLIGFPTNLLALFAFIQKIRVKATPNCILLLNLTISDLCFLVFLLFKMAEQIAGHWAFPTFLCPFSGLVYFSTIYTSTLFLTAGHRSDIKMQVKVVALFLAICLLTLEGASARPGSVESFDNNNVGSNSFNDNGNSYNSGGSGGNGGSFDNNKVGDNSFNDNGNSYNGPEVVY
ncbi:G-protein coupled receptor 42, partial [Ophiophagus hannah]